MLIPFARDNEGNAASWDTDAEPVLAFYGEVGTGKAASAMVVAREFSRAGGRVHVLSGSEWTPIDMESVDVACTFHETPEPWDESLTDSFKDLVRSLTPDDLVVIYEGQYLDADDTDLLGDGSGARVVLCAPHPLDLNVLVASMVGRHEGVVIYDDHRYQVDKPIKEF